MLNIQKSYALIFFRFLQIYEKNLYIKKYIPSK